MNVAVVFEFLKKLLPMNKIGAFLLGLVGAALALFLGVNNADLKSSFCAADAVSLPAPAAAPAAVLPAPAK